MKNIRLSFIILFIGLSLLWLLAEDFSLQGHGFWPLRTTMVHYSGILAMGAMSVAMLLAMRPVRIERFFDGLDKTYRLHKWLGISALVLGTLHWGWARIPKWLVGWGWLERPARKNAAQSADTFYGYLHSLRGFAEGIGEWAFYAAALLLVLALSKRVPYRWFFKSHRLLALAYLVLVVHSSILLPPAYWESAVGPLMILLMLAASVAAGVSLTRRVGRRHQVVGRIDELHYHRDNHVLRVGIDLDGPWPGHLAGQFAFVTFDAQEGPHPFSICSAWHNDGKLAFSIKGLGDYTRSLPERLRIGNPVTVEGPYGCFDFRGSKPQQIWIAGGIGIAPFIARLQALAPTRGGGNVTLFYSTSAPDRQFIERIRQLAAQARVQLHVLVTHQDGRLTPERMRQLAPQWKRCDIWFCGPAGFARDLRDDLQERGLPPEDFHQELFNMR